MRIAEELAELGKDTDEAGCVVHLAGGAAPGALNSGNGESNAIGFATGAGDDALTAMNKGGGHAMRHLIADGLIANTGNPASKLQAFKDIVTPILENPTRSFDWRVGITHTKAFGSMVNGQWVVVFVAKEGPWVGKVIGSIVPDASQIVTMGLK